jgi:hypothetical protein
MHPTISMQYILFMLCHRPVKFSCDRVHQEGGAELDRFVVSNLLVEIKGPATLVPTIVATKVNCT